MPYRVGVITPKKLEMWQGKECLWLKCRIEEDGNWISTRTVRLPYPIYFEDLEHDLMVELDVGNIRYQQHMEWFVPSMYRHMWD